METIQPTPDRTVRLVRGAGILDLCCAVAAAFIWNYSGHRTAGLVAGAINVCLALFMIFGFGPMNARLRRRVSV